MQRPPIGRLLVNAISARFGFGSSHAAAKRLRPTLYYPAPPATFSPGTSNLPNSLLPPSNPLSPFRALRSSVFQQDPRCKLAEDNSNAAPSQPRRHPQLPIAAFSAWAIRSGAARGAAWRPGTSPAKAWHSPPFRWWQACRSAPWALAQRLPQCTRDLRFHGAEQEKPLARECERSPDAAALQLANSGGVRQLGASLRGPSPSPASAGDGTARGI